MDAFWELFSMEGRANRMWYFWHILLDDFVIFGLIVTLAVVGVLAGSLLVVLPAIGVIVGGTWAAVAITVKRLHDLGRPGWHWWLMFVPIYNLYLGLVLLFKKGTFGPNRYGGDPLAAVRRAGYLGG